jgi:hypothetical protein
MKTNPNGQAAHERAIEEAVEVLKAFGLPTVESPTAKSLGRETPFSARNVLIPVPSTYHKGLSIDLTTTAVDQMLVAMFDHVYRKGLEHGVQEAEQRQALALLDALPSLKGVIKDIADDVARERVEELRSDLG